MSFRLECTVRHQVATQRSFIMIGVVLLGVLFDRPALTMRTLTIAALVVLLFAPESIVHPSFQMSFAATLALIAGYERGAIKLRGRADTSLGARAALSGANAIVGLTIASLLAGLATTPYAAFHFHRVALWRHCQSPRHADRLGHADGNSRHRLTMPRQLYAGISSR